MRIAICTRTKCECDHTYSTWLTIEHNRPSPLLVGPTSTSILLSHKNGIKIKYHFVTRTMCDCSLRGWRWSTRDLRHYLYRNHFVNQQQTVLGCMVCHMVLVDFVHAYTNIYLWYWIDYKCCINYCIELQPINRAWIRHVVFICQYRRVLESTCMENLFLGGTGKEWLYIIGNARDRNVHHASRM